MSNQSCGITRRNVLANAGLTALLSRTSLAASAPAAPVTLARCTSYDAELLPTLARMFDQTRRLGPNGERQNRRREDQPHRQPRFPAGLHPDRPHHVDSPFRHRRHRPPAREGRRPPHSSSREPLEIGRTGPGGHDCRRLGSWRCSPARRRVSSSKTRISSGFGKEYMPIPGAPRRPSVSRFRSQPLLSRTATFSSQSAR